MGNRPYLKMRELLEKLFGVYVYRRCYLPAGVRLDEDLRRFLPHFNVRTAFDVGANVGQSVVKYLKWFRGADIYCFEPVSDTFAQLSRNMAQRPQVHCYRLAVGAKNGPSSVHAGETSDLAFIPPKDDLTAASGAEAVSMVTLDAFSDRERVRDMDFLKIDTEGHDLAVLQGCERLLTEQRIGVIELEAGMTPANRWHVPFEDIKAHLQRRGYSLFGLYEQVHEWTARNAFLRRVDPVFVSQRVVEEALAAPQPENLSS